MQRLTLQSDVCSPWMLVGCEMELSLQYCVGLVCRIATARMGLPDSPEDSQSARQHPNWCAVHACRSSMPIRSFE